MREDNEIHDSDLSGPIVNRRTTIRLLSAAGMAGLAGCLGGSGSGASGGGAESDTEAEPTGPPAKGETGGRLQAGWFSGSMDVLDPPYITVGQYFQIAANIFNGLVALKKDLTIRGDLAKDWTVENGGKRFTFDLREGVKFHNGTDFTADDVRYTIHRTISKDTPAATRLSTLKPVERGGVVVKDDYTVELNFKQPMAPALVYLTRGPGRAATIVNEKAITEMGQDQYSLKPVGTGPFKVVEHEIGAKLTLDAFEDYFETDKNGTRLPYLDGIDIKPIPEPATLVNALRSGDIDFSNLVPLQNIDQIEQSSNVGTLVAPGPNWYGLAMNTTREPFKSKKARLGIAKSINNEEYVSSANFGNALADIGPLNKATKWVWREDKPNEQNYAPEEGKKLLEEAGATGASFSILTTKDTLRNAKVVRQQLNRAGLNVDVEQVTNSTYWKRYENLEYDTTVSGSVGDPDPDQSLYNFFRKPDEGGAFNWTNYTDDKVHQWLADQRTELNREKRKEILWKIEDRLIAEAPSAFLSHKDDIAAKQETVNGFVHIPYMRNFHTVWVEK